MVVHLLRRRLAGWALWASLLACAYLLLTHPTSLGVPPSTGTTLAIVCIVAATVLPNVLRRWTHPEDGGSTFERGHTRVRWRRTLASAFGIVGAVAIGVLRAEKPGESLWLTVLEGGAMAALVGYMIGDRVLPELVATWSRKGA